MTPKATYFLSDFHLGSRWFASPRDAERRVVAFLDSIKAEAEAIYLLGDILDYWYEYRYVVPRGFVRFFGKLAELSDSGVKITWLIGNHDIWIFDYLPTELGIEVVDGSIERQIGGSLFYLAHGDGVGERPKRFRFLRSLFRNRICQKLYSGIHPRWTVPMALGWSKQNRGVHPAAPPYRGPADEPLIRFAASHLAEAEAGGAPLPQYYLFGHRHILVEEEITSAAGHSATVAILGEWIDLCSYARFDGHTLTLNKYNNLL